MTNQFVPANTRFITIHKQQPRVIYNTPERKAFEDGGVVTPTEIGDLQGSLIELNKDDINLKDKTSGIDLRTRLHPIEISAIVVLDNLVTLKFLPPSVIPVTLQKKRLNVSMAGKGREEIVKIVQGKTEQDALKGGGMTKGLFGMFQNKNKEE
jgi:hypothetical protein